MQNAFRAQISVPTKEYAHSWFMEPVSESESAERNVQNVHGEGGGTLVRTSTMIIPPPTARTRTGYPSLPLTGTRTEYPPPWTQRAMDRIRHERREAVSWSGQAQWLPPPPLQGQGQDRVPPPHPRPGPGQGTPSPDTTYYGQDTPRRSRKRTFLYVRDSAHSSSWGSGAHLGFHRLTF